MVSTACTPKALINFKLFAYNYFVEDGLVDAAVVERALELLEDIILLFLALL